MSDSQSETGYIAKILTSKKNDKWVGFVFQQDDDKAYSITLNSRVPKDLAEEIEKLEKRDYVTFHYRAKTLDGKEYDSSYKKGKPATYRANGVIPGFTEAIQMMQPGAKWELYIPPELAYGRQGPLAHQTVIIEVELLSIGGPDAVQKTNKQQGTE